ncbi:hypothetical protein SAY86_008136 [Trapa natans]|uniref:PGG domain-containing protein n=1 Tax=Trapa natans TaxID=22666 RepID=A0AAN7KD81_TRANT|nr:hypothetical protein SAY86_008136 [Trapa natans]
MAEMVNSMNNMGFTALEVLNNQSPLDYKSLMIREILIVGSGPLGSENIRLMSSHGGADPNKREGGGGAISETGIAVTDYTVEGEAEDQKAVQKCLMWARGCLDKLLDYRGDWMNETKGSLMMVSTIIATVTFSAAVAPPGGVWQEDTTKSVVMRRCRGNTRCAACSNESVCVAGAAVLRYLYPDSFIRFMKYDMIAFASSLVTVFLLISGFPLNNKFTLWILSLDMCVTITFLGLTFLEAISLITPPTTYENNMYGKYFKYRSVSFVVWMIMIGIVGIFLLIRLCYWFKRPNKGARMMVMGKNHSPRLPESKC